MTKEYPQPLADGFLLSENERLFDTVTDQRFHQLVFDSQTTIHEAKVDSNSYGEFLFVTVSRAKGEEREVLTFWGLGFHEHRERWFIEEWRFHQTYSTSKSLEKQLSHEEAQHLIQERQEEIQEDVDTQVAQSSMGALFEMLADMTDDDGALSELEDLGNLGFLLDEDE